MIMSVFLEFSILVVFGAAAAIGWYDKNKVFDNIEQRKTLGKWITYGGMSIMYGSSIIVYF